MIATGPAELLSGEAAEEGTEGEIDGVEEVGDLVLAGFVGEGHTV